MRRPETVTETLRRLRWPLRLTWAGILLERLTRAFWPAWSVVALAAGLLLLGIHDLLPPVWARGMGAALAILFALLAVHGLLRFRPPALADALERLDRTLPGRPIEALLDEQAIGARDSESRAVWQAHIARMAARAAAARPPRPDLRLSDRDPLGLRYIALLVLCVGLVFGSWGRVGTATGLVPEATAAVQGPAWEGWIEPPGYTGRPSLYLADLEGPVSVPQGSEVTIRLYGDPTGLRVVETVSANPLPGQGGNDAMTERAFEIARSGRLEIAGPGGRAWEIVMEPDLPPSVELLGPPEAEADGRMVQKYAARDDFGVVGGSARIVLDMPRVSRRYGLAVDPEPRPPIEVDLPIPIRGDRTGYEDSLIEDFSKHPWANLPVTLTVRVEDELGQTGEAAAAVAALPGRRFFDPLAAAIVELRRDLLWSRENARRTAQVMRAISWRGETAFRKETSYLKFRFILRRLESFTRHGLTAAQRDEIAEALWALAIELEEGDLSDALERLRRAQERLAEAIRNGATPEEIEELMRELREATNEYLRQLSRQAQQQQQEGQDGQQAQQGDQNSMQMTMDDLQRMMDRIQELMEQGRMAEAEQALRELQQMMENMRVTQGQGGQGQSPGEQAMEGLAETLREQQGLSDEAFRDLQEQFNPDAQAGESQQNEGRDGGLGRGQAHSGQEGQGQGGGDGQPQGEAGQGEGGSEEESLAQRQRQLREELNRQRRALPQVGGEAGENARRSLERAEGAMEGAEDALRQNDLPRAIDRQAEAIEALREGIRNLGEALAQEQRQQGGQQGTLEGDASRDRRDPLGRTPGSAGEIGTDEQLLQGEDVYRRARELLDEIRRRSNQGERPTEELEYLKRLLDRF